MGTLVGLSCNPGHDVFPIEFSPMEWADVTQRVGGTWPNLEDYSLQVPASPGADCPVRNPAPLSPHRIRPASPAAAIPSAFQAALEPLQDLDLG
jgi:hypothetical protein